ncbi:MAG: T9SS type A sorting domain-containing protein [Flavobacteriales bacterium]|nr:T9SS type A sorting domain-containing protein [Flavobacteriales bacterium]
MRTSFTLALTAMTVAAAAQCLHDPLIAPDEVILCPSESITLTTQEADSYQWLKDGTPIPGADQQDHIVSAFDDGGSMFTVIATVDGCAEASPGVLVDGWVFLLPFVMHAGDDPIDVGPNGSIYCEGDTALLILMPPYDTNIQWTESGNPIPGADNDTLVVTEAGSYSASGAPGICPNFQQQLGVTIAIAFQPAFQPTIIEIGDMLCIYPNDFTWHQWYFDGEPMGFGECFTPTVAGSYTVSASYIKVCGPGLSEPHDVVLGIHDQDRALSLRAWPNPATDQCTVTFNEPLHGAWRLMDASGRLIQTGRFNGGHSATLSLVGLEPGNYFLLTEGITAPFRIAVVR